MGSRALEIVSLCTASQISSKTGGMMHSGSEWRLLSVGITEWSDAQPDLLLDQEVVQEREHMDLEEHGRHFRRHAQAKS